MSIPVIHASGTGARLDSNVLAGGGTDDTAVLQEVLDRAASGAGVHLVMDGAALISGLTVHSNTTIECLNRECGFYLADGANRPLLINANPSPEGIIDRNITLLGGTYNHNCAHQAHHLPANVHYTEADRWVTAMAFLGVEHLTVRDVTVRNMRTFAFLITNWQHVLMEHITLELTDYIAGGNQDGIHLQGPGRFLVLRHIQGRTGDDLIAINADEETTAERPFFHPCASTGPVSDVLIDTVMADDASQILRILSRESPVDRITVRNVSGTYRSFGFYLSAWDYMSKGLNGNFGSILFENVTVRSTAPDYTYTDPFLFRISGKHRHLILRQITCVDSVDDRYAVYVEGESDIPDIGTTPADVGILEIDGLSLHRAGDCVEGRSCIMVRGKVGTMNVRNCSMSGCGRSGAVFLATEGAYAAVDRLILDNISADGPVRLIDDPGRVIANVASAE